RATPAVGLGPVEPPLGLRRRLLAARRRWAEVRQATIAREGDRARDVVDVTSGALRPTDQAHRGVRTDRDIHKAFSGVAALATHRVALQVIAGLEAGEVGLIGDDAHRARFRAGTVQRALRAGQRLDALDVINVDVQRTLNCGHWLFVEVHADARQRTGMVGVVAACHTAHVDLGETRAVGLVGDARQEF